MEAATAVCGCGREMRLDALVGPLAFRCGCGASFTLKAPQLDSAATRCVYVHGNYRCSMGRAQNLPVCLTHAAKLAAQVKDEYLAEVSERLANRRVSEMSNAEEERLRRFWEGQDAMKQKRHEEASRGSVVYYVQLRPGQVKIGTTIHLEDRMKSLRAHQREDVLAAEPGTRELEKIRHAQFKNTRIDCRREDFLESPDLLSHIQMVREHFGDPFELVTRLVAEGAA